MITLKPLIFVSYAEATTISDTTNIDTRRSLQETDQTNADTARIFGTPDRTNASARRVVHTTDQTAGDLSRRTRRPDVINVDLSRVVTVADISTADVRRMVYRTDETIADIIRRLHADDIVNTDLRRTIAAQAYADNTIIDAVRIIHASDAVNADTSVDIYRIDIAAADTVRSLSAPDDIVTADLIRNVGYSDISDADTALHIVLSDVVSADTTRHIAYLTNKLNPESITISLQRTTLADQFSMTVPYDMELGAAITGRLLDYDYNFIVDETSGQGLMRKVVGVYDKDVMLYTPFTYTATGTMTATDHARLIAAGLGKSLSIAIDDFTPAASYAGTGATYQNIISGVFGWMGNLPQRWINVLIRGDTLYIIQRGHEPNTIDITDTRHTRPDIGRKTVRSVWSGHGSSSAKTLNVSPEPFSGTITFGGASVSYRNGLAVHEVRDVSGGTETTDSSYNFDGYITSRVTDSPDSTTTTTYTYATTANDKYLANETAVTVSKKDSSDTSTQVTEHVFLGNGWYGTTMYQDGERQGSSISQGRPGGKASQLMIDQSNSSLGSGYGDDGSGDGNSLYGAALFDTEFPVKGADTLIQLTKDIEWLNRKTEETLSMTIWHYGHLIDFTDKIVYHGNTYYLESNQITRTPGELKQDIQIIRWY
jgi:hypothetical protein